MRISDWSSDVCSSDLPAPDVEADRDSVAVLGDRLGAPLGLLEGGGADVDPAAAGIHRGLERLVVADAAAHLDLDVEGADDLGLQLPVVAASEGGVPFTPVPPIGTPLLPAQVRPHRVPDLSFPTRPPP